MLQFIRRLIQAFSAILLCSCLAACFHPYKFEITQGNVVTPEQMAQLHLGMSEDQVLYLLGNPLLQDVFHAQRWDYVYYNKPGYKPAVREHVVLYFENGQVVRIQKENPESAETESAG